MLTFLKKPLSLAYTNFYVYLCIMKRFNLILMAWALCAPLFATSFATADSLILAAISENRIPGAVLCVVHNDKIVYEQAYGNRQVYPDTLPMTTKTIFDLASLSKVVGTGMTMMTFIEEGLVSLDAKVSAYLPEYEGDATIRHLMTHTSGLPAYAQWKTLLKDHPNATAAEKKAILLNHVCHCSRLCEPGADCTYSCLNFITLQYVMEAVSAQPLSVLAQTRVFRRLGMKHTGYCFGPIPDVAPTEIQPDSTCLIGVVHDPLARVMNSGVSGNAGVFSNAEDLSKLAIWMLQPRRGPFSEATLRLMMTVPADLQQFGRALAWDCSSDYSACRGTLLSHETVCHTGYTGTSMVVDPENKIAVILLANRVHPYDKGGVNTLRKQVADAVANVLLTNK